MNEILGIGRFNEEKDFEDAEGEGFKCRGNCGTLIYKAVDQPPFEYVKTSQFGIKRKTRSKYLLFIEYDCISGTIQWILIFKEGERSCESVNG